MSRDCIQPSVACYFRRCARCNALEVKGAASDGFEDEEGWEPIFAGPFTSACT